MFICLLPKKWKLGLSVLKEISEGTVTVMSPAQTYTEVLLMLFNKDLASFKPPEGQRADWSILDMAGSGACTWKN